METYILMGICLVTWIITVVVFRVLMKGSENSFLVGSLAGLMMALAVGGVYLNQLASCRTCL